MIFFLRMVFRVRRSGAEYAHEMADPVMLISRRRSRFDALLLAIAAPRNAVVIVPPDEARSGLMRWLLRSLPHEVLDIGHAASLKPILKLLRARRPVALFPEGRVTRSSAVAKVYPVAAVAAAKTGAAVVPVAIGDTPGAGRGGPWTRWVARALTAACVEFLPARRVSAPRTGSARERRLHATRELTSIMQEAAVSGHPGRPLFESFLHACAEHGRNTPIIEDPKQGAQTYGAVLRASLALMRLFRRFADERERVGVLLPNLGITVQTILGLSAAGCVPVMLNYSGGVAAARAARAATGLRTVVTSRRFIEQARLQPLVDALAGVSIVYLEDLRPRFRWTDRLWLVAYAMRFPMRVIARHAAADPAVVLLTSGSDGEPKAVVLPHRAIIANVVQMRTVIEFTPEDKILNPLPLYHAYSFTAGMALPLVTGTRLYLYVSPLHYRAIPDIVYRSDCTVLFGTSTFLSYYAAHAHPQDFSRLRYVISGGEKLSPEVARVWLEKFGLRIYEGYGCTECAPVISLATPGAYRPGTVGRLLPGIEHRIEPVTGIEAGGVLHLRGPNLMLGHHVPHEPGVLHPCRSAHGPGWYDTGDVVEIDEEGFVTIHGRMRRFAKIAGEMVSLDHVEQVARRASPAHFHAAVLKVEEYGGETTVLFTTDSALDRIAVQKAARAAGSRDLAVPRQIVKIAELPLLPSGKTDYARLTRMARSQAPQLRQTVARLLPSRSEEKLQVVSQRRAAEPALPSESNAR